MARLVECYPADDSLNDNPYRALIGSEGDDSFSQGLIRITPPFAMSPEFARLQSSDVGVSIKPQISDSNATLLWYEVDETHAMAGVWPNQEKANITVQALLSQLGMLANQELFKKMYGEGN